MEKLIFTKMHGLGNDFILINDLDGEITNEGKLAKKLCDRHFSIGADGIILVRKSSTADIEMVIYNSDGSYASMCGNGIRCFAKYVWDKGIVRCNPIKVETGDGVKEAELTLEDGEVSKVTINMGKENFKPEAIPAASNETIINKTIRVENGEFKITSMRMGVPHTVVFCNHDEIDVKQGRHIEKYELFPEGTNVNYCEVVDDSNIKVKTWERGAGETLACGTGCCSCVIASNKLGHTKEKVNVKVPGGIMEVEIKKEGVFMTGPAVISFEGKVNI